MAVKRVPRKPPPPKPTRYRKLPRAARLHANDFQSLISFVGEHVESCRILGGNHAVIDSGDDLRELQGKERRSLTIHTRGPSIVVKVGSAESYVETSEVDSTDAKSLVDQTVQIIDEWASLSSRIVWPWFLGTYAFAAFFGTLLIVAKNDDGSRVTPWLGSVFAAVIVVIATWLGWVGASHRVLVHRKTRSENQDARTRFVSNLAVGVIGGVIGAIATYFIALQDK